MTNQNWIGRETTKKASTKRTYSKAENGISQNLKVMEADI